MSDPDAVEALRAEIADWKAAERDRELAAQVARYALPERVAPEHVREAEARRVRGAVERRRQQEERSRRYDRHLARMKPQIDRLLGEIADLDADELAARDQAAIELAEIVDPLVRKRLLLAREIARLQEPPADDAPERPSTGQRLRALVGGRS